MTPWLHAKSCKILMSYSREVSQTSVQTDKWTDGISYNLHFLTPKRKAMQGHRGQWMIFYVFLKPDWYLQWRPNNVGKFYKKMQENTGQSRTRSFIQKTSSHHLYWVPYPRKSVLFQCLTSHYFINSKPCLWLKNTWP